MPASDDDLPGDDALETPPKPTPKKKPDEELPAKKAVHQHTQRLISIAESMGFSQADLDNHPSEVIWEEVHRLNALAAEQTKAKPAPKVPEPEPADPDEAYLAELEKNPEVDQRYVKLLRKALAKPDDKALQEKLAKLDALEASEKARTARQTNDSVDTAFAALPKKFIALVGEDAMADLTDPGQRGWRAAIYQAAKIDFAKDSQRTINKKIADAAAKVAAGKVEEDEPEPTNDYEAAKPKKKAKDPETGRFTIEQFNRGAVARPSGKKAGADDRSAVEKTAEYLRQNGDPRGFRPAVDMDDDLPE